MKGVKITKRPEELVDCREKDEIIVKFRPSEDSYNIFFDMDGVLALFRDVRVPYTKRSGASGYFHMEDLYDQFYYLDLPENKNIVKAARLLTDKNFVNRVMQDFSEGYPGVFPGRPVEVYVFSCFLSDSAYALDEKHEWLDEHLPEVDMEHRILLPCGLVKGEHLVLQGNNTVLIDDYTKNLLEFSLCGGEGIKCLNGINHTHKTWTGKTISIDDNPRDISRTVLEYILELGVPEGGRDL